jgi:hypothetical protein
MNLPFSKLTEFSRRISHSQLRAQQLRAEFYAKPLAEQVRLLLEAEDRDVDDRIAELQMERRFGKADE